MSTSSYFSQIFPGSTYFESEYDGINDSLTISSKRSVRQCSPSPLIFRSSQLPSPILFLRLSSISKTTGSLSSYYSAPHLHLSLYRIQNK
ncbi:unnamed protein product [Rotaria sordida]|uniref:Uncharacterized protein n=1 Tax=Rotaria sordida TaxID=392033 RepID=A0A816C442_9BILA|nr:unnamed protein product [Rotaria sordida]CAF1432872.1 unnamed protein product [Rotaria sordida]CAF1615581.1 unnamed protein product [Rotaria sordida]CAF4104904.1 unnamed protein product [Rotaria sordida]CAF4150446.1 unnamed protein product [Rotaria sordida]